MSIINKTDHDSLVKTPAGFSFHFVGENHLWFINQTNLFLEQILTFIFFLFLKKNVQGFPPFENVGKNPRRV